MKDVDYILSFFPAASNLSLACVADVTYLRLVTSAKQRRDPCSGSPKGLKAKVRFKFPIRLIGKLTMAFLQPNHGTYSNPGTQVGTQNKNFSAVSQMDFTRV